MKIYYSNKSWIIGIFLWGMILSVVFIVPQEKSLETSFLITYSIILLFVSLIWFGIRYQIKDQCLLILIGPIRLYSIPIEKIESINRSYNPLSSPAASLKRMKVNFDGGMVLISPKYEKQFVKNLKEINPDIYNGISWENENESILTRFVYSIL